jgi:hypothetical protein
MSLNREGINLKNLYAAFLASSLMKHLYDHGEVHNLQLLFPEELENRKSN